jgi:ATP-binding cassette subfamily C protein LapB
MTTPEKKTVELVNKLPETWNVSGDTDSHDDPLLDSLMQLAKLHGMQASRTGLKSGLPLVKNKLTVELFQRAADRIDLTARLVKRKLTKLSNIELPAVLLLDDRKALVLVGLDKKNRVCKVLLPESGMGEQNISYEELGSLYSGYALFVKPKYKTKSESVNASGLGARKSWFWGTIFSSWRIYRDVFVASFLINLFGLASPFFVLNVYDRVIPNSAFETLWVLGIGISVIYVFGLFMRALRGYFIDEAGKKANLLVSATLFQKVLGLRMESKPKSVGSFSKNLQQFESILDFITSFTITALIDLPFVCLGLFAIWYIAGQIVYIHLISIAILFVYAMLVQIPLKTAIEKSFKASAQKNAILVEGLQGLETIKMLGAESQMQRSWEQAVSYIAKWSAKSRLLSSSVNHLSNFIQSISVVAVVIAGVYLISRGEMSQGGLIALVILSRQAIAPMSQVISLSTRFHRARVAMKTLNGIMDLPEEKPAGKTFLHRTRFNGAIELKNVCFRYAEQPSDVINNVSVKIAAGEKVGIIGSIGSGKTTLGKLILGLYEPSSGMISMDETDIRQIDPSELRRYIGYVSQDITLFRGTLRENLILGCHDIDDKTLLRALDLSGVSEIIKKHPKGIDLEVGEQGSGLSGGQRQVVAMARAILTDPPVLVFDEPTSSMDNRTEQRMKEKLNPILKGKSMLLITHRASLLDLVDRIIVLDNGTVIADGPRQAVLNALKSGQISM